MSRGFFFTFVSLFAAASVIRAAPDPVQVASDEQTLKSAQVASDGPALIEFFRKRTITEPERDKVQQLIKQLGDSDFEKRELAAQKLIDRGPVVMKQVSEALKDSDLEIAHRAQECLEVLTRAADPSVAAAAVRLLAGKKPTGAVEGLLAYLPFVSDEAVVDEVREALSALAMRDGKPEKDLLHALEDKLPLRRAAAAEALARAGNDELRGTLKKFLKDKDGTVRLWAALAFFDRKDRDAVPVLIDLLTELSREQAWRIEDRLCRFEVDNLPSVALGTDEPSRKKCRDAWMKWWDSSGSKLDLSKMDLGNHLLGYTLMVQMDFKGGNNGKVKELDKDGKLRWEITGLRYAIDARVIRNDRVLIVEYTGRSVSERNFKGEVLWKHDLTVPNQYPLMAQRLPNGNTFIACRNALIEVDRDGKEVFNIARGNNDVFGAQKLRNGQIVVSTNTGLVQFLDTAGKELKSLTPGYQPIFGGGFEVLPNGHLLMPLLNQRKVVELDAEGKVVWEAAVPNPSHATRLPNGNTLVVSMATQEAIELDQTGKEVWKQKADTQRLFKARRR